MGKVTSSYICNRHVLVEAVTLYFRGPSFESQPVLLESVQFHLLYEGLGQFDFLVFPLRASDCYG